MIHVHIRDDEHRPDPRPGPADRRPSTRCGRAPTWSSSSPPAARCTTRSTSGSGCSTRSRTRAASPWARRTSATTCSPTRGRSSPSSTSSPRSARWSRSSSCSTSATSPRCTGCWRSYGLPYGGRVHVDLVMGVPGGHARHRRRPGRRGRRAAGRGDVVVGHRHRPLHARRSRWRRCRRAATCGSAWRTCSRSAKGVPVEHNAQLVERVAELGRLAQRTPMSTGRGARPAAGQAALSGLLVADCRHAAALGRGVAVAVAIAVAVALPAALADHVERDAERPGADARAGGPSSAVNWSRLVLPWRTTSTAPSACAAIRAASVTGSSGGASMTITS